MSPAIKKFLLSVALFSTFLPVIALASPPRASASGVGLLGLCDVLTTTVQNPGPLSVFPGLINALTLATQDREWLNQSPCQFSKKVFSPTDPNEIFGERYTYAQINWIINSLAAFFFNTFFGVINPALAGAPLQQQMAQQGIAGHMGQAFAFMQSNQISLVGSLSRALSSFGLAMPVHAQGFGYTTLTGTIQALWTASRNATYLLMIIALVAAGFMVMFRVRINPQTAVTLQLMIPKIITSLLAITFSYALAGLVIDLVYFSLSLVIYLIDTAPYDFFQSTAAVVTDFYVTGSFGGIWAYYNVINFPASLLLGFILPGGMIILPILFAILMLRALIAVVRAYFMLLIHIISGPFQILAGLIPTSQSGFGSWMRNVIGHAAVFFVVPLLFLLSMLFLAAGPFGTGTFTNWLASILPTTGAPAPNLSFDASSLPQLPLISPGPIFDGPMFAVIIGYVILLIIPTSVDQTIKAFKAFSFGSISDLDIPLATS